MWTSGLVLKAGPPLNLFKTHRLRRQPKFSHQSHERICLDIPHELQTSLPDSSYRRQRPIPTYTRALKSYPSRANDGVNFCSLAISENGRWHARVLKVVVWSLGSMVEDVVLGCPDLIWKQVFGVMNRLRREGRILTSPIEVQ